MRNRIKEAQSGRMPCSLTRGPNLVTRGPPMGFNAFSLESSGRGTRKPDPTHSWLFGRRGGLPYAPAFAVVRIGLVESLHRDGLRLDRLITATPSAPAASPSNLAVAQKVSRREPPSAIRDRDRVERALAARRVRSVRTMRALRSARNALPTRNGRSCRCPSADAFTARYPPIRGSGGKRRQAQL